MRLEAASIRVPDGGEVEVLADGPPLLCDLEEVLDWRHLPPNYVSPHTGLAYVVPMPPRELMRHLLELRAEGGFHVRHLPPGTEAPS